MILLLPAIRSLERRARYLFYCNVYFFFGQRFLDTLRADSHQILRAGVLWFPMCLCPFWGLAAPGGRKKGEINFSLGVNGEFLHFGGFRAISQQRVDGSTPNFICVGTMSAEWRVCVSSTDTLV